MKRQTQTILLAVVFLVLPILLLVPSSRAQVVRISRGALLIPKQVLSLPNASVRAMVRPQVRPALKQAVTAGEAAARTLSSGAALNGAVAARPASAGQSPALSSGAAGSQPWEVPAAPAAPSVVLYDQYNNPANFDITSQDFEAAFNAFDDQAADDFVVPGGQTWTITGVDVDGEYNGGPAASVNVYIYANSGTLPGALVYSSIGNPYANGPFSGDFVITLTVPAVLTSGTYWVSVQTRQDFGTAGQWFWQNRAVQSNSPSAWQNPGGGFGTPCATWGVKTTCIPSQVGPDQVFRLNGTVGGGATPTPTPTPGTPTPTPTPNPCQYHVLIAYSDTGAPTDLQNQILAEPGVVAADLFDAQAGTPTLAQLQQYQIVVPYSNFPFADNVAIGNNLADYVDGGGIVVQYGFSHYGPGQPYGVNGRWVTGNYNPYNYSTNLEFNAYTLGAFNAGHPLMAGVTTLNSNFGNIVTLAGGATQVAATSNGNSLVAFRPVSGGHTTVGVTAYVGPESTESGHWGRVIVNAGRWLITCATPTPTNTPTNTPTPTPPPGSLTDLSPAKMWVGLKNSDDVGLRLDLLAEVFINATQVGQGEIDNVASGSSGFNNAILQTIPLSCTGCPIPAPPGSQLKIRVSARKTCTGGGHTSGSPALWYNGQPIDAGLTRDAGSRFDATIGGSNDDYFLRLAFALEKTPGSSRTAVGVFVNSSVACPARPFTSFGTWIRTLP